GTLALLWANLPLVEGWNPRDGWCGPAQAGNPYPSAYLLLLLLLANLPEDAWAHPKQLEEWLFAHHPYWSGAAPRSLQRQAWVAKFLLGLAYQLRLLQAAEDAAGGEWVVRLSPLGRWVLGLSAAPTGTVPIAQTLLVQPNLEIVVYRQALTPGLITR